MVSFPLRSIGRLVIIMSILIIVAPASTHVVRIVMYAPSPHAIQVIQQVDGTINTHFPHTNTFIATIPESALPFLVRSGIQFSIDQPVFSAMAIQDGAKQPPAPAPLYPSQVTKADQLHQRGLMGNNIGIAIIDSGMPPINQNWTHVSTNTLKYTAGNRSIVYKDLLATQPINNSSDPYGHGTHVLATIADGRQVGGGIQLGVAPEADLIVVRALDAQGTASYSEIIEAIEWVIAQKDTYNIRVLNLSLQAPIHGPYWHDPLNQAVMAAWQAGITVVVASGNVGPAPATITVPGNVPYVITVGSLKPGAYTASGQDELASYSSVGPTESKFVKPDILIAGSRVVAPLPQNSVLQQYAGPLAEAASLKLGSAKSSAKLHYYFLSGTSMSAAEVSGITALLLQDEPNLTNDQVKQRLMSTAERAVDGQNQPVYAMWQQGAGRINAQAAIDSTSIDSANSGLNIATDRDHEQGIHYTGATTYEETTNTFSITGLTEQLPGYTTWTGNYAPGSTHFLADASGYGIWTGGYGIWTGSAGEWSTLYDSWAGGYGIWTGNTSVWSSGYGIWTGNIVQDDAPGMLLPLVIK